MPEISRYTASRREESFQIHTTPYLNFSRFYNNFREAEIAAREFVKLRGGSLDISKCRYGNQVEKVARVERDANDRIWTDVWQYSDPII